MRWGLRSKDVEELEEKRRDLYLAAGRRLRRSQTRPRLRAFVHHPPPGPNSTYLAAPSQRGSTIALF